MCNKKQCCDISGIFFYSLLFCTFVHIRSSSGAFVFNRIWQIFPLLLASAFHGSLWHLPHFWHPRSSATHFVMNHLLLFEHAAYGFDISTPYKGYCSPLGTINPCSPNLCHLLCTSIYYTEKFSVFTTLSSSPQVLYINLETYPPCQYVPV